MGEMLLSEIFVNLPTHVSTHFIADEKQTKQTVS